MPRRNPNGQTAPRHAGAEAIQGLLERICRFARRVGASEQFCAEVYHSVARLSQEKGDRSRCQRCLGAFDHAQT